MASRTEQLEREAEGIRADLSLTLDELRSRMTPGQLVDQMADYMRDGDAAAMVGNLRRQVVQNPLALGLVGAGLAWLMIPRRANGGRLTDAGGAATDQIKGVASTGIDSLSETGRQAGGRVTAAGHQIADSASSTAAAVAEGYGKLAHTASGTAAQVKDSVSSFSRGVAGTTGSAGQTFVQMCKDQPLILAGLGLAIGAAIGASLPRTESEDRLMGSASDDLKERAESFAGAKMEGGKEALQETAVEMEEAGTEQRATTFGKTRGDGASQSMDDASASTTPSIIPLPDQSSTHEAHAANWEPAHSER
jgi:hypothetical protein